jgi:hypothetical protein
MWEDEYSFLSLAFRHCSLKMSGGAVPNLESKKDKPEKK